MVTAFLEVEERLLEFNINGCLSSVFFNELNISQHKVVIESKNGQELNACASNKMVTKSSFSLELDPTLDSLKEFSPTALVLGYSAKKETQELFKELCNTSKNLRLVIYESDIDTSNEFIAEIFSVLKGDFHPHVTGKYTVLVKGDAPKTVKKLPKTTKPLQAILAVCFIVLSVLFVMWLRRLVWC